jgi:hypothetical protein
MAETDPVKYFQKEIKRLNYYNSQFLKEDDFRDEQLYHKQMRYLHNRGLHTWGVVQGLEVKQVTGRSEVTVAAGVAIDRLGREVVLSAETDAIALDSFAANSRIYVTINFAEVYDPADKDPSNKGTESAGLLYMRTTERPEVNATKTAPAADAAEVVLGVVVLDKDKAIAQVDTALRRNAGSRFGSSADGREFGLYADSAGVWHFADAGKGADRLTIDDKGNVGIGTGAPKFALQVGDADKEGSLKLCVAGRGPTGNYRQWSLRTGDGGTASEIHRLRVRDEQANTDRFVIDENGNVGIGVTSPGYRLDVQEGFLHVAYNSQSYPPSTAIGGFAVGWNRSNGQAEVNLYNVYDNATTAFQFSQKTGNQTANDLLTILGNGNVGIGKADPRTALDTGKGVLSGAANDYIKAQFTLSGGGTVTWGGAGGRLKWTNRFIAITMGTTPTLPNGHININLPTSDITAANVYDGKARSANSEGVVLNGWEALYAVHNVGGNQSDVSYRIVRYDNSFNAPSNWILVAVVNADDNSIKLGTGLIVGARSSIAKGNGLPCGAIVLWSGKADTIPDGWALCDGGSGTPNLQDRFVVGAGSGYGVGATGGAAAVSLTVEQMPSHNHQALGSGKDDLNFSGGNDLNGERIPFARSDANVASVEVTRKTGGDQAHENRPPYYALCYIMKLY